MAAMARDRPLDDYRKKRDFGRTPEPAGAAAPDELPPGEGPCFVVHRHEARNLHYDLRLELDGVLLSWAVPKGFSYDPSEKRLAVRTEDHPLEYVSFSGLIPPGEYGAGALTVWDAGRFRFLLDGDGRKQIEKGDLKLQLSGRRLRGEWHLVRTRQSENSWLLFKSKDHYAGPARDSARGLDLVAARWADLPRSLRRMEPAAVESPDAVDGAVAPFTDADWFFEPELAGRRLFATLADGRARLRGLRPAEERRAAEVLDALQGLHAERALLDGVLVVQAEHQRPDRVRLAARLRGETDAPLLYYAFDLLHDDGLDLRLLPLRERKTALRAVLPEGGRLLYVDHVGGDGPALAAAAARAGLTHLVAKRAAAPWTSGASENWRRVAVGAAPTGVGDGEHDEGAPAGSPSASAANDADVADTPRPSSRLRLTNPGKVYWPEDGFTKGDLIAYLDAVAEHLLPHLKDRPVHMDRYPDGIHGKSFYQRHGNETLPDWIRRVEVRGRDDGAPKEHFVCDDRESLLALANLGSIDLHPWLSRVGSLERPDHAVLDLDPKGAPFAHVVRIAKAVGRLLHGLGLRPRLKTSGKSGLHIYVPLAPDGPGDEAGPTYEQSRLFCEVLARMVCRELPDIATVERSLGSREGKVYVDFGQNRRGATVVPPYVPRPVPGGTVSAPMHWDELEDDPSPARFTIRTMPARLAEVGELFAPVLHDGQDLVAAIGALDAAWRGR